MTVEIDLELLLSAYCQGVFPMGHLLPDGSEEVLWYDPDPRAIIPLDDFHVPRRLERTVRSGRYQICINTAFPQVIQACAELDRSGGVWITPAIITAYTQLHQLGFVHSVESWRDGRLVGGLYGVAVRGLFAGESMFNHERDASKVALVHLVNHLRQRRFQLLDTQFMTDHLRQFGTIEIPQHNYKGLLARALAVHTSFTEQ